MHKSIKIPTAGLVATKLKEARIAAGLSTHKAAESIKRRFPGLQISHATIANYEKSATTPGVDLLGVFAVVYERPINWFLESGMPLTGIRYRFLSSKTRVKERQQFERQSQYWLEAYIRLERRLDRPLERSKQLSISPAMSAEEAARIVRQAFQLKDHDPIPSVIEILEAFGIRTIEMPTTLAIDGFAASLGDEPVVVLKPNAANDRCRLNAGHELAHVLFGDCDDHDKTSRGMDDRAFEFASHLLIPRKQLRAAFEGRSAVRLVQYKERFGVSMASMIFQAEKTGIIEPATAKHLWIQFSRRGWRANEPGTVRADRAIRFETLLDQAISERQLKWREAAEVTGVSVEDLKRRRDLAMGILEEEEEATVYKIRD